MPVKTVNPQMRQIDGSQDPIFNVRTIPESHVIFIIILYIRRS